MKAEAGLGPFATRLFDLSGQVALVTGAGRGLGREMAHALASAGALVVLHGRNREALEESARRIRGDGGACDIAVFDIDDAAACATAIDDIVARHGRLDILVNNAGIRDRTGFAGLTRESMTAVLHTNVVAATDLAQRCAQAMIAGGRGGRIINIGSIASISGQSLDPAYSAAKAALAGVTRSMATEYGRHAITVNDLSPGPFATEFNAQVAADPALGANVRTRTMVGRWGLPEELAGACLFLASPGAAFLTGQQIVVDGGFSVKGS